MIGSALPPGLSFSSPFFIPHPRPFSVHCVRASDSSPSTRVYCRWSIWKPLSFRQTSVVEGHGSGERSPSLPAPRVGFQQFSPWTLHHQLPLRYYPFITTSNTRGPIRPLCSHLKKKRADPYYSSPSGSLSAAQLCPVYYASSSYLCIHLLIHRSGGNLNPPCYLLHLPRAETPHPSLKDRR